MRLLLSILLISVSLIGSSQEKFTKDLTTVISDSANHFFFIRGSFRELQGIDSVFGSKITIEGTKENDILSSGKMTIYRAIIVDSVNERKGKKLIEEWQQKIASCLGTSFKVEKSKVVYWNPTKGGWIFRRGNIQVSVDLFPHGSNSSLFLIVLGVTDFSSMNEIE